MATITFNPLANVDFTLIDTSRTSVDQNNAASYDFDAGTTDIDIEGSGLTYDGALNATGGAITRIDVDLGANQGSLNGGDFNINGLNITATADLAAIDNSAFSLFGIALQGSDTFFLSGLNEDIDTPTTVNRVFGDDLSNIILFTSGSTNTNTGGNDTYSGGDNQFEISGDVWRVNSSGIGLGSTYTGGNDAYFSTITEELNRVAGDAWIVDRTGAGQMVLNGGDDVLDLGGNTSGSSFLSGDVNEFNNGLVNGGDDELISDDSSTPEVAGDVRTYNGGTLNGGDDVISLSGAGRAGGDVFFLNSPVPTGVFTITGGADEISGGSGSDIIGGEVFDRETTVDNLIVGGDDVIFGGAGDDDLFGEVAFGDGTVGVSGGNDVMFGGNGNDEVRGQTGDDLIDGGNGDDTVDGGAGNDLLSYATAAAGVAVNLLVVGSQNTIGAGFDSILGFEDLTGSRFNDTLRGNALSNMVDGGRGADLLFSGAGQDVLTGGAGNDTINTVAQVEDLASGGNGDDTFEASGGGNFLVGNFGLDTVSFSTVLSASTIDLTTGRASQNAIATVDILFQIENAIGGASDDDIIGNAEANSLAGLGGNDEILGGAGNDTLSGGDDEDTLQGDDGDDALSGSEGDDSVDGGIGNDTLNGDQDNDTLLGGVGNDQLVGADGNDNLNGGNNNDTLDGGLGKDRLSGSQGVDDLSGGAGVDTLDGGQQNDFLSGGDGGDTYTGGGGADTMIFAPVSGNVTDVITDFEDIGAISDDLIDVTAYGFASVASIVATANGDDVILDFGAGDRVRLQNYLLNHTLAEIDAGDFLI